MLTDRFLQGKGISKTTYYCSLTENRSLRMTKVAETNLHNARRGITKIGNSLLKHRELPISAIHITPRHHHLQRPLHTIYRHPLEQHVNVCNHTFGSRVT